MMAGSMPPAACAAASSARNSPGRTADWTATSSKKARWPIWSAMSQPAAGVGVCQPGSSRPTIRARVTADSAARSAASAALANGMTLALRFGWALFGWARFGWARFGWARFDHGENLAGADLLPRLGPEFGDHAGGGRGHRLLHLHRLQYQQRLTRGHEGADLDQDAPDQPGHGGEQRPGGGQLLRITEPRHLGQGAGPVAGVDVGVGADPVHAVGPAHPVD